MAGKIVLYDVRGGAKLVLAAGIAGAVLCCANGARMWGDLAARDHNPWVSDPSAMDWILVLVLFIVGLALLMFGLFNLRTRLSVYEDRIELVAFDFTLSGLLGSSLLHRAMLAYSEVDAVEANSWVLHIEQGRHRFVVYCPSSAVAQKASELITQKRLDAKNGTRNSERAS